MVRLITAFVLLLMLSDINAQQFGLLPLSHNPQLQSVQKTSTAHPRNQSGAPLPFFDDFSYDGPFPAADNWTDNQVFVNTTLGHQPVSVGVATFDGLDASGNPYGGFGSADTLTSIPLDLSGTAPKYISYYIEPKGLGDAPGPEDRLLLEFKNREGEWVEVLSHEVTIPEATFPIDSLPEFQFIGPVEISDAQYLHEDFQFRFRNFALRVGAADYWHLDYVRLEETPTTADFDDLAFATLPSNIFFDYTSAPWPHLRTVFSTISGFGIITDTTQAELFNHSSAGIGMVDDSVFIESISSVRNEEVFSGQIFHSFPGDTPVGSGRFFYKNRIRGNYLQAFENVQSQVDKTDVVVEYKFAQNNNEPQRTRINNTARRTFVLDNYYAYDDGSAESAYFAGTGAQVALQFTNYLEDSLRAVRLQIPRIVGADLTSTSFILKIWVGSLDSEPVYQSVEQPLFVEEYRDSLQAFVTYQLKDDFTGQLTPVLIPAGDFFVGWQQLTTCNNVTCLPVGFDRNNNVSNKIFIDEGLGAWSQIWEFYENEQIPPSQQGALMINPIFGSKTPKGSESVVRTNELPLNNLMTIYPNPTSGQVFVELSSGQHTDYHLKVTNAFGQVIQSELLSATINLEEQPSGMYFLYFTDLASQQTGVYKLFLRR